MSVTHFHADRPEHNAGVLASLGLPRAHVLIIDDNRASQALCASYCDLFDHRSVTASACPEAIEALGRHRFDVAVVNVDMPGADGLDVVSAIRRLARSKPIVPLVGLIARTRADEAQRWKAAGLAAVVVKPVTARALFAAIRSALEPPGPGPRSWASAI